MRRLEPFDVTLTLCFTPRQSGTHTAPYESAVRLEDFADFCETIVRRYAPVSAPNGLVAL